MRGRANRARRPRRNWRGAWLSLAFVLIVCIVPGAPGAARPAAAQTPAQPDLRVAALSASATRSDQPTAIYVTLASEGGADAPATKLYGYVDPAATPTTADAPVFILSVPAIAAGGSTSVSGSLTAGRLPTGNHTIWVLADGGNSVAESDEGDNASQTSVAVQAPVTPRRAVTWGSNFAGELGNGSTTRTVRAQPSYVDAVSGVTLLATGGLHDLAVTHTGEVWTWGWNHYRQLGRESGDCVLDGLMQSPCANTPANVPGLTNVVAVAASYGGSLALKADGTVWEWGDASGARSGWPAAETCTSGGQSSPCYPSPVRVPGLDGVTAIAAGGSTYGGRAALKGDGTVWVWGHLRGTPAAGVEQVPGLADVVAIAAGEWHLLALRADGSVWAMGTNQHGELGQDPAVLRESFAPVQVGDLVASAIATGDDSGMALKADGTVWTWGSGADGRLGADVGDCTSAADGVDSCRIAPAQVAGLPTIQSIASGQGGTAFAVASDGSVWAWGSNVGSVLGTSVGRECAQQLNLRPCRTAAAPIAGLTGASRAVAGIGNGLAIADAAQLPPATDLAITGFTADPQDPAPGTSPRFSITVRNGGSVAAGRFHVHLYGDPMQNPPSLAVGGPRQILEVPGLAAGASVTLTSAPLSPLGAGTHRFWAWADAQNSVVETSEGDNAREFPVVAQADLRVASFSATAGRSDQPTPLSVTVANASTTAAPATRLHVFVDRATAPTTADSPSLVLDVPEIAPGASTVVAGSLPAGRLPTGAHTLRALADGANALAESDEANNLSATVNLTTQTPATLRPVVAWGSNFVGELGNGTPTDRSRMQPAPVPGLTGATRVAAGWFHDLALTHDGRVWSWGYNNAQQLGRAAPTCLNQLGEGFPCGTTAAQVPGLTQAISIAGGFYHSLATRSDGTVWGWGSRSNGQVPESGEPCAFFPCTPSPVQIPGLSGVVQVAAGSFFSLALQGDGTVWGWGQNMFGQLGTGSTSPANVGSTPVRATGLADVAEIAAADIMALARTRSGDVWAWGGAYGPTPIQVPGAAARSIAAGGSTLLILRSDGSVWRLGAAPSTSLERVTGLPTITALGAGVAHVHAVATDGSVWAWGSNPTGQLGTSEGALCGGQPCRSTPARVPGLSGASQVAGGLLQSLAIGSAAALPSTTDISVESVTGTPSTTQPFTVRVTIRNTGRASAGPFHVHLYVDPRNEPPGSATGDAVAQLLPVSGLAAGRSITLTSAPIPPLATGSHAIWARADGQGSVIESNESNNTRSLERAIGGADLIVASFTATAARADQATPLSVTVVNVGDVPVAPSKVHLFVDREDEPEADDSPVYVMDVGSLAGGASASVAGSLPAGRLPTGTHRLLVLADGAGSVAELDEANNLSATLTLNVLAPSTLRSAATWGANQQGELGDGTALGDRRAYAAPATGTSGVLAVAAGEAHSLGRLHDGRVLSWGSNQAGQLGRGASSCDLPGGPDGECGRQASVVEELTNVSVVAAGARHSLAVKADGTVWGWGDRRAGQVPSGGDSCSLAGASIPCTRDPVQVAELEGVIAVAAGEEHSLALKADGTVWAWGGNGRGQLGMGSTGGSRAMPTRVQGLEGVTAIAAGAFHSLAVKGDGSVWAWGDNRLGQLGRDPGGTTASGTPLQVSLGAARQVAGGAGHSLAIRTDGTVWAWGANDLGQLGVVTSVDCDPSAERRVCRHAPALVPGVSGATVVAAGGAASYARLGDGSVRAWGGNAAGQLGVSSGAECGATAVVPCRAAAVRVSGLSSASAIAAGGRHALAVGAASVPRAANLAITAVTASPSAPTAAQSFHVSVTVRNTSSTTVGATHLYVYVDAPHGADALAASDPIAAIVAVPSLGGGRSTTVRTSLPLGPLSAGTHRIRVVVDGVNAVPESQDGDDTRELVLTIGP